MPALTRNDDSDLFEPGLVPLPADPAAVTSVNYSARTALHPPLARPTDRPGRVLLLSQILPPLVGGSSRYFWELARRMPREQLLVVTDDAPGAAGFDATHDLPVVRLPMRLAATGCADRAGLLGYWRLARAVARLCREQQVYTVWCGRCVPEGWVAYLARWLTGVPFVVTAHGEEITLPDPGAETGVMTSRQHRWMARRVFARAAGVVANSENTRRILRDSWAVPDASITTLTPGVDADRFRPANRCPAARQALGWGDRPVLLTVGRLHTRKGHDQMIAALPAVRRKVPDVLYAVVGDGPERGRLEGLARQYGVAAHVRFHGEADDATALTCFQQCDLFVLPNRQVGSEIEGFGMVLLEAQACGVPVIAGASGGTAETLHQPDTGRLVDCTTPGPLAAAVTELLADPARLAAMGRAARAWAASRFGWAALADKTTSLLTGVGR